jgi:hypothetical protein
MLSVSHKHILNQQAHFDLSQQKIHAAKGHSEDLFPCGNFIDDFHITETQRF